MKLSDTQHAILAMIAERIDADGMPPSQVEIARAFGFSGVRAAQYHLEALEAAGAIERVPGRARGIRVRKEVEPAPLVTVIDFESGAVRLPVLGKVSAGSPIASGPTSTAKPMRICCSMPRCSRLRPTTCCASAAIRCATTASSTAT